jgi:hypothetical protein
VRVRGLKHLLCVPAAALLAVAPSGVTAGNLSLAVEGFRAELTSRPGTPTVGQETAYSVRLFDRHGAPVRDATVVLGGRMSDGMTVLSALRPSTEPGLYSGRVLFTMEGRWDLTLRVAAHGKRFELALPELVTR